MNKHSTIRSITALVLLLMLTIGVTPKRYLHDFFAHHQDRGYSPKMSGVEQQVSFAGFNCDDDNLVSTSPFTAFPLYLQAPALRDYVAFKPFFTQQLLPDSPFFYELRGPPVAG